MLIENIQKLIDIGIALSSIHNLDKLLDLILSTAQTLTNADSGSIYLVEKDKLIFKASRSNTYFTRWGEEKTKKIFKNFEMPVTKNSIAGYVALTLQPLNIPDVRKIPSECEYHYNPTLDKKYNYETISMLVTPLLNNNNKIIGVLQLINSIQENKIVPFTEEHQKITLYFSSQAAVAIQNAKLTDELKNAHLDTILRLASATEIRDKETANHLKRVSHYSRIIAKNLGFSKEDVELIFLASPMHDIGKVGIPDSILLKPGKLTPEERKIMEKHTIIGAIILKDSPVEILVKSRIISLTHHEKFDGTGYPRGLKGKEIPIEGRIIAVADVYDALSSKRYYKDAFPEEKVIKILQENRGTHFDPEILDVFLKNMNEVKIIRETYIDKEEDFDKFSNFDKIDFSKLI